MEHTDNLTCLESFALACPKSPTATRPNRGSTSNDTTGNTNPIYEHNNERDRLIVRPFVRSIMGSPFSQHKRYLSDVISINSHKERIELGEWLYATGASSNPEFYLYVQEDDHIHVIHVCSYSNGSCRCRWRQANVVRRNLRPRLHRHRNIFASVLGVRDWENVLIYFIVQKRIFNPKIWIRGRLQGLPSANPSNQSSENNGREVLDGKRNGHGRHCDFRQFDFEESPSNLRHGNTLAQKKRSKFDRAIQEVKVLIDKYYCIPPEKIRDIITPSSEDFNPQFFDPMYKNYYFNACSVYRLSLKDLRLIDFKKKLQDKLPIFYAPSINPFEYYHNVEDSTYYLVKLLQWQFNEDAEAITEFLTNLIRWYNREGWLEPDGQINNKCNTIICWGPPNCGKNYFFDTIISLACNVGHIGRVNNKTNNFPLQDTPNRRLIVGNEISLEEGAIEDMKKLCEGVALNVNVKHLNDQIVNHTPVLFITNTKIVLIDHPAFKDLRVKTYHWKEAHFLAESNKKAYPMALFNVFKHYNVSID